MNNSKTTAYQQRFARVFDYIDSNLDANLSVLSLSEVACFSKYHFHRQFSQIAGLSVYKYIQLQRLKRASYQLSFRDQFSVTDVAMMAGFDNAESFSRAFRKTFGQSPSQFKKLPEWDSWKTKLQVLNHRASQMQADKPQNQVTIINFETTKLAVLEHRGNPGAVFNSVKTFIEWRKLNKLSPKVSKTYNIIYEDPATVAPKDFQIDICASTKTNVQPNDHGVINKTIPGGRCAVLRHIGTDENISNSFEYLYGSWLPQSGEEVRDFPCFLHRVTLFPDVNEHQMITDIYLPLQ